MKKYVAYLLFDNLAVQDLLDRLISDATNNRLSWVVTPNLDDLRLSFTNFRYRKFINSSPYCVADGHPLVKISRNEGFPLAKISGSDLTPLLLSRAAEKSLSVFFFGGAEGVADLAAQRATQMFPGLTIAGTLCPEFGYNEDFEKEKLYAQKIAQAQPHIVLLCTGSPKSQFFFEDVSALLPNAVYLFVGATIDFLAGNIKRAPKWVSRIGLEWLYRAIRSPRLIKRVLKDAVFLLKLKWYLKHKRKVIENKISECE